MRIADYDQGKSTDQNPLLSVVIPAYQCRRFITQTIKSVLDQLQKAEFPWEVFIVDDASPEGDPLQGSEFLGKIRVHRQPHNIGHPANLNFGISLAVGQLIHVLHGDDFVLPGFYDTVVDTFRRYPHVHAVFTQCVIVNEQGQWTGLSSLLAEKSGIVDDLLQRLAVENVLQTPSIVVRKEAYERLGLFNPYFSWTEDWEMWARIAARFPVAYVDRALCAYRQHGASSSSRHFREGLTGIDTRRCLEAIWSYLPAQEKKSIRKQAGAVQSVRCLKSVEWAGSFTAAMRQVRTALWFNPTLKVFWGAFRRLLWFIRRRIGRWFHGIRTNQGS
jgi:glycosyltransferase involved in cell wall biosynthesis